MMLKFPSLQLLSCLTNLCDYIIIQLTEGGVITEPGQNVLLIVEMEHEPEPGHVQTQLQLMVVQIVLGRRLKVRVVMNKSAQVGNQTRQNI